MANKKITEKSKKTEKVEKKVEKPYFIKVSFNDFEFESKDVSFGKALAKIVKDKNFTSGVKTRVILTYGDKKVTRNAIYSVPRARRLFSNFEVKGDNSVEIFANQLTRALI